MREFKLKSDYIELVKLIKLLGLSETGGYAKIMVDEGAVLLNGNPEFRKRAKLRRGDFVVVSGEKVHLV